MAKSKLAQKVWDLLHQVGVTANDNCFSLDGHYIRWREKTRTMSKRRFAVEVRNAFDVCDEGGLAYVAEKFWDQQTQEYNVEDLRK